METRRIAVSDILPNEGQIEGLPRNPRQWTGAEVARLKKSIKETPELLEARGVIVTPYEGKYIVLGGNMRLTAVKELKHKDVPCIVIPEGTPVEKLKEIVIKDNGAFGSWDFDSLANEWDDLPLTDWGVPAWSEEMKEETQKQDLSDAINPEYKIEITCVNETEQEQLYNQLIGDGYECRILTL